MQLRLRVKAFCQDLEERLQAETGQSIKISRYEVGHYANLSDNTMNRFWNDPRANPTIRNISKMAKSLERLLYQKNIVVEVSPFDLLELVPDPIVRQTPREEERPQG